MTSGWTEIVHRDEDVTDPTEARRLFELRLGERGINLDELDLATQVEIRQWLVRRPDGSQTCAHEYLVRDEAL
jgi:hypothetical protein